VKFLGATRKLIEHKFRKVRWTLYVDRVEGGGVNAGYYSGVPLICNINPFQPSVFQHAAPIKVTDTTELSLAILDAPANVRHD
jgi:hypothetical protein